MHALAIERHVVVRRVVADTVLEVAAEIAVARDRDELVERGLRVRTADRVVDALELLEALEGRQEAADEAIEADRSAPGASLFHQ